MSQDIDYRRVRKYVEENLSRRKSRTQIVFFIVSLFMFILFNVIAWLALNPARFGDDAIGAMVLLTVGWAVSLLYHFINIMLNTKAGEQQMRESLTLRGIQLEMARKGMAEAADMGDFEKPKRHESVQLSDDGELVDEAEIEQFARKTTANER